MSGEVTLLPAWREAAKRLADAKISHGDAISHEQLRAWLEMPQPSGSVTFEVVQQWQLAMLSQVDALRDYLLEERRMLLVPEIGRGYRIAQPSEQTDIATKDGVKKARRAIAQMQRQLLYVDTGQLTDEQRKQNVDAQARAGALRVALGRNRVAQIAEPKPKRIKKDSE